MPEDKPLSPEEATATLDALLGEFAEVVKPPAVPAPKGDAKSRKWSDGFSTPKGKALGKKGR